MDLIVVGIDGSTGSAHAVEWAATEASRTGIDLEIVHALDIPGTSAINVNAHLQGTTVAELENFSQHLLDIAAHRVAEVAPTAKVRTRMQIGSPTGVLIDASRDASALVVGSRGLGTLGRFVGSVSLRCAARAHCPVFVIPDQGRHSPPVGPIVAAVDDSDLGAAALRFALIQALSCNTSVRAVTAYQLPVVSVPLEPEMISGFQRAGHDQAVRILDKMVDRVRSDATRHVAVETVVGQGSAADVITGEAKDAQLIVVGSHGRGAVRRVFLGSVSQRLLHQAEVPVAVVNHHWTPDSD